MPLAFCARLGFESRPNNSASFCLLRGALVSCFWNFYTILNVNSSWWPFSHTSSSAFPQNCQRASPTHLLVPYVPFSLLPPPCSLSHPHQPITATPRIMVDNAKPPGSKKIKIWHDEVQARIDSSPATTTNPSTRSQPPLCSTDSNPSSAMVLGVAKISENISSNKSAGCPSDFTGYYAYNRVALVICRGCGYNIIFKDCRAPSIVFQYDAPRYNDGIQKPWICPECNFSHDVFNNSSDQVQVFEKFVRCWACGYLHRFDNFDFDPDYSGLGCQKKKGGEEVVLWLRTTDNGFGQVTRRREDWTKLDMYQLIKEWTWSNLEYLEQYGHTRWKRRNRRLGGVLRDR